MKRKLLKKIGLYTGLLLCGVSGYSLMHYIARTNSPDFNKTNVVIDNDTISIQQFYYNLSCTDNGWIYTNPQGHSYNIDSLCDYHELEKVKHQGFKNVKLKKYIDTIFVSYTREPIAPYTKKIVYQNKKSNTFSQMPAIGKIYNYNFIAICEFKADNPKLQKQLDIFNDRYNCTFDHEYSHFLNHRNGIYTWNSYPIKFVECCLDEVAVNIKQCLSQRNNYIKNGFDIQFITNRFAFYQNALKTGKIKIRSSEITESEARFIANSVFDSWMENKFNIYTKQECTRVECFLKDAPYNATLPDTAKHQAIMQRIFTINGIDFWKYISLREKEVFSRITPEMQQKWQSLCDDKFQNMDYLEKLELLKITQGKAKYDETLSKNKIKARIISALGKER